MSLNICKPTDGRELNPDRMPAFMNEAPRAERTQPNQHVEKDFVNSLLKLASDFYRSGLKPIWLRKNAQGVGRTYDGKRVIKFGLGTGVSDCVGYTRKIVTPDMVGKPVAIFTAIEAKAARGTVSEAQQQFIDQTNRDGGLALIAWEPDGVHAVVDKICP